MRELRPSRGGLTLLELVVIIVVLAILSAMAIPTFASIIARSGAQVDTVGALATAKDAVALAALSDTYPTAADFQTAASETKGVTYVTSSDVNGISTVTFLVGKGAATSGSVDVCVRDQVGSEPYLCGSRATVGPAAQNQTTYPAISSVSPGMASAGSLVTIGGLNFGSAQGSSYVSLMDQGIGWGAPGNAATFLIVDWSNTAVTFVMPNPSGGVDNTLWSVVPGTTATVTVTVVSGAAKETSNTAQVHIESPSGSLPTISSFTPNAASAGTSLTVTGSNFGSTQGSSYVTFADQGVTWGAPWDGATFRMVSWANTSITFVVPTPSGGPNNNQWAVVPGTTATVTVTVVSSSAEVAGNTVSVPVTSPTTYNQLVANLDPGAWWKLSDPAGSATAADSSGNGYTATNGSSLSFGSTGPFTQRPADTSVSSVCGGGSALTTSLPNTFTAKAWTETLWYRTTIPYTSCASTTMNAGWGFNNQGTQIGFWNGSVNFGFGNGTGWQQWSSPVANNVWQFLTVTYNGSNSINIYVDGVLDQHMTYTIAPGVGDFTINGGNNGLFDGSLAGAAIFPKTLTPTQVANLYAVAVSAG